MVWELARARYAHRRVAAADDDFIIQSPLSKAPNFGSSKSLIQVSIFAFSQFSVFIQETEKVKLYKSARKSKYLDCRLRGMGETSDFTFCQVGLDTDQDNFDSPKTIPNISNITIRESATAGDKNTLVQRDGSICNDTSKGAGVSATFPSKTVELQTPPSKEHKAVEQAASEDAVNGLIQISEIVNRKPIQRTKVPFEKGCSQMDWLKLTRTHPDLAGLKGQSNRRLISMDEVRNHKKDDSVWTVLKGRVYNISPYLKFHPGGVDMLMKAAGKDCTSLFNKYHAWVNAEFLLEQCMVGILDDSH